MLNREFIYPLSPEILQWLAGGQLGNRFARSLRLWVLLNRLYSGEFPLADELEKSWSYPELRGKRSYAVRLIAYLPPLTRKAIASMYRNLPNIAPTATVFVIAPLSNF